MWIPVCDNCQSQSSGVVYSRVAEKTWSVNDPNAKLNAQVHACCGGCANDLDVTKPFNGEEEGR